MSSYKESLRTARSTCTCVRRAVAGKEVESILASSRVDTQGKRHPYLLPLLWGWGSELKCGKLTAQVKPGYANLEVTCCPQPLWRTLPGKNGPQLENSLIGLVWLHLSLCYSNI